MNATIHLFNWHIQRIRTFVSIFQHHRDLRLEASVFNSSLGVTLGVSTINVHQQHLHKWIIIMQQCNFIVFFR